MKIPFDPIFGEALNEGQMVEKTARSHKLVDSLRALAHLVGPRHHRALPPGNRRALLAGWLKRSMPALR